MVLDRPTGAPIVFDEVVTPLRSHFRGSVGRAVGPLVVAAALVAVAAPATAGANQLNNARAEAAALNAKIQALGYQEAALSERYDAAQSRLSAARSKVSGATRSLGAAERAASRTMSLLQQDAVQAYVGGGPQAGLNSSLPTKSVTEAMLGQQMAETFASAQTDALDSYRSAAANEVTARARLVAARNADARQLAKLAAARDQVQAAQAHLVALEDQVTGQIAAIVAQIRHQQFLAEQRAAEARLAAERAAAARAAAAQAALLRREEAQLAAQRLAAERLAAQRAAEQRQADARRQAALRVAAALNAAAPAVTLPTVPASTTPAATVPPAPASTVPTVPVVPTTAPVPQVPGVSQAASLAVQAALSRVGDPYVWGASGPGAFDCSGLVMWAYGQAGVSLPHFSGAQYAETTPIPMSALQPGDLVFPADPAQHVAMYIGNGMVVQAPYTGADVQVVPLSPFFVLASRVG